LESSPVDLLPTVSPAFMSFSQDTDLGYGAYSKRLGIERHKDVLERSTKSAFQDLFGVLQRVRLSIRVQSAKQGAKVVGEQIAS
jgi:hypothetical protein